MLEFTRLFIMALCANLCGLIILFGVLAWIFRLDEEDDET